MRVGYGLTLPTPRAALERQAHVAITMIPLTVVALVAVGVEKYAMASALSAPATARKEHAMHKGGVRGAQGVDARVLVPPARALGHQAPALDREGVHGTQKTAMALPLPASVLAQKASATDRTGAAGLPALVVGYAVALPYFQRLSVTQRDASGGTLAALH